MIPYGSLVVLTTPRGRRHIKRVEEGREWHTSNGALSFDAVAAASFGDVLMTSRGQPLRVAEATLQDLLLGLKRQTQIIYPKDIAFICMRLGAGPERFILESGCGSGALTMALSWFCGPTGKVLSRELRADFARLARRNLDWAGVGGNVRIDTGDLADGFGVTGGDALFLDMREPWLYLEQAVEALRPGATCAFILPTTPQVSQLMLGLEKGPFGEIEVCELLLRSWKPLADRLRPQDRMAAHTGFLIFCRLQKKSEEFEAARHKGTRERKQEAAREARMEDDLEIIGGTEAGQELIVQ